MKRIPVQFLECVLPEIDGDFHYQLPEKCSGKTMMPGTRLLVPFGKTWKVAYFIRMISRPDVKKTKAVLARLDQESLFKPALFKLLCWISEYYQTPLGSVLKCALPQGIHVVPRRRFFLADRNQAKTYKGQSALAHAVIHLFLEKEALLEREIQKNLGKGLGRIIYHLKTKGILQEKWEVTPPPVKTKVLEIMTLNVSEEEATASAAALQKKAPRQAEAIHQLLLSGGSSFKTSFNAVLRPALTPLIQKKIIASHKENTFRVPMMPSGFPQKGELALNNDQKQVLKTIKTALKSKTFTPFLLHGVTGSGKTEIYLHAISEVLERGEGAILLLPEIGLTTPVAVRFQERFGEKVALLHSGLSTGERYDEWRRIREGKAQLVIGARSAIFAPLNKVGLIVVDEEHDPSYRQDEGSRYHGRDAALVRGRDEKSVVILGSATPSFESFFNVLMGKYKILQLPHRIDKRVLPEVRLVNMKDKGACVRPYLSKDLYNAIKKRITAKEQTLLFINRRGFSPLILCHDCGFTPTCTHCSVTLTFHKRWQQLVCHYCGLQNKPPTTCPECESIHLNAIGIGTEQIEETVRGLFPEARIARLDRDTTQKKGASGKILSDMAKGDLDILIGTQMISKGHDFPKVTLVGVISADMSLHVPDFRSSERTFQLLAQVSGRAGRGEVPGEVIIQSLQVDDETIRSAASQDFVKFYEKTITTRKQLRYPPFCRLALILIRHKKESVAISYAEALAKRINQAISRSNISMLGPAPAPLLRLRETYRYQILLKADDQKPIARVIKTVLQNGGRNPGQGIRLDIEIDPQQFV